jgi:hypothetical protein
MAYICVCVCMRTQINCIFFIEIFLNLVELYIMVTFLSIVMEWELLLNEHQHNLNTLTLSFIYSVYYM